MIDGPSDKRYCSLAFELTAFDALRAYAKRHGISFSEAARRAINSGLAVLEAADAPEPAATG
jgi:hypothetical protein